VEKVIVVSGSSFYEKYEFEEVNNYLTNGWTVKSVTPVATKDYANAIFVLEKK